MTVWKYRVALSADPQILDLPKGAEILRFGRDPEDELAFWARVDPDAPDEPRVFRIVGTGASLSSSEVYVGTEVVGPFVWHLFEGGRRGMSESVDSLRLEAERNDYQFWNERVRVCEHHTQDVAAPVGDCLVCNVEAERARADRLAAELAAERIDKEYAAERAAALATGVGIARVRLPDDPVGAKDALDDACGRCPDLGAFIARYRAALAEHGRDGRAGARPDGGRARSGARETE